MTIRRFKDPIGQRIAIYETPPGQVDPDNINDPSNAPLVDPANNLQYLYYHSDLDPMEVAIDRTNVTVNHLIIAAGTGPGLTGSLNNGRVYGGVVRTHELLTHDLGYVPDFFILVGNELVHPGWPVQYDSADGRARRVRAYATSSKIMLEERGVQTSTAMAAVAVTYTIMVLRRPPGAVNNNLDAYDPVTDIYRMAGDKFRSDRRYLQVVPGGSPFGIPLGRTLDFNNGTYRSVSPSGSVRDVVPASFRIAFGGGGPLFGPDGNYKGSFTGDPAVLVQAP